MKLSFRNSNGRADDLIEELIDLATDVKRPDLVRQIIIAALKAGQESLSAADLKLMNTSLKEMRFTAKIFGPYRGRRKVTVFGSARSKPSEPVYQMAKTFGRALANAGFMVITGGGGGIMQAANEGAGPEHSFGANIQLPYEQQPNQTLIGNPRLINYKYFFNRKVAFIKETDAVALFPGGFGTLDEAMEVLTLLQTGKRYPMPLLLLDSERGTYWHRVTRFFREELEHHGYIDGDDFRLYARFEDVDAAVEHIKCFYSNYHSMRYVRDALVLRLLHPPAKQALADLTERFRDILYPGGGIRSSQPLTVESDEPAIAHLSRILVDFNRSSFGRLRTLIDVLNRY